VIDFRYHLVSIIAVFLALAVGLVVGSTALSGKAEEALKLAQHNLLASNRALEKANSGLTNQVSADQAFAQAASPRLIAGLLAQEKVVLVVAPGAEDAVTSGVTAALKQAGATVTGQVQLQQSFMTTSAANEGALTQLADKLAGDAGLAPLKQSQSQVPGQQAAAQVLAASLLASSSVTGLSVKASGAILSGFSQAGFVSVGSPPPATATLAILVTPGGPAPQTGSEVLAAVAAALNAAGQGTVMVGASDSVGAGSVISNENGATKLVSTVDNADTETGQIMVVQALAELLNGKPPAQYGIAPQAAPSPAPTPSATPSGTTSAAAGSHS
jgi:Copper transport outer membrane protein, MctB